MGNQGLMDIWKIKKDFPQLDHGLHYLDSAATSLKPRQVVERIAEFSLQDYASVHRGIYQLGERSTELYEASREKISRFVGRKEPETLVFTRNTTESLNLLASSLSHSLEPGDEVLLTEMEHHSNIVPWFFLREKGIKINFVPVAPDYTIDMDKFQEMIHKRTKIVSFTGVSNVLGTINPVRDMCRIAHENSSICIVDGAQYVPHMKVDIDKLGVDFLAFSGHKMLGPSGIGALVGNPEIMRKMPPYQGGGEMIRSVTFDSVTYEDIPLKFEAGTPNIEGAVGFAAAVDYLQMIGMDNIRDHEREIMEYVLRRENDNELEDLVSFGPRDLNKRAAIYTFNIGNMPVFDPDKFDTSIRITKSIHPHDLAHDLDSQSIDIRSGHHCAMPLLSILGQSATARASFYIYNDKGDVDALFSVLEKLEESIHARGS